MIKCLRCGVPKDESQFRVYKRKDKYFGFCLCCTHQCVRDVANKFRRLHRKPLETGSDPWWNSRLRRMRSQAIKRGFEFNLSMEDFKRLKNQSQCSYCKQEILIERYREIDRKDSKLGFIIQNVVMSCKRCNGIKGSEISYEDMITIGLILNKYSPYYLSKEKPL